MRNGIGHRSVRSVATASTLLYNDPSGLMLADLSGLFEIQAKSVPSNLSANPIVRAKVVLWLIREVRQGHILAHQPDLPLYAFPFLCRPFVLVWPVHAFKVVEEVGWNFGIDTPRAPHRLAFDIAKHPKIEAETILSDLAGFEVLQACVRFGKHSHRGGKRGRACRIKVCQRKCFKRLVRM